MRLIVVKVALIIDEVDEVLKELAGVVKWDGESVIAIGVVKDEAHGSETFNATGSGEQLNERLVAFASMPASKAPIVRLRINGFTKRPAKETT